VPLTMSAPPNSDHTTARVNSVDTVNVNAPNVLGQESARQAYRTLCRWALAILIERRKTRRHT